MSGETSTDAGSHPDLNLDADGVQKKQSFFDRIGGVSPLAVAMNAGARLIGGALPKGDAPRKGPSTPPGHNRVDESGSDREDAKLRRKRLLGASATGVATKVALGE